MSNQRKIKCLIVDDEPLGREIIETYISRIGNLELIASCPDALQAFEVMSTQTADIIFLDIRMPHLTGMEFIKQITPKPLIVFTTAYSEFAVEAFELDALDYLVKPIEFSRFLKSVNKAFNVLKVSQSNEENFVSKKETGENFIYLKIEKRMEKVFLKDLCYIESLQNQLTVHTLHKKISVYRSISQMEETLPTSNFLRVHRSYIVGIDHINSFTPSEIVVNGTKVPVGRKYKALVKDRLGYR